MNDLRPTIVRLLSNMASPKEIQQYLKRFSQLDAARFAVVKVGGAVLSDDLENLVSSLAFLQQVGLTPIVVHGAGPQLNEELAREGITTPIVDGLRVTPAPAAAPARPASTSGASPGATPRAAAAKPPHRRTSPPHRARRRAAR